MNTTVTTTPEQPETGAVANQEFDDAFAEATAESPKPAAATNAPEGAGAAESATPAVATATPDAGEAGTATPAAPSVAAVDATVEAGGETPDAKIARLESELAAAKQPAAPAAPEPAAATTETAPAAPATPAEPQWYQPSDDEKAVIKAHDEQWPDISRAEAIRTKAAVYNAVQYVFQKMGETYGPVLQRFNEMADTISTQLTLGALRSEHEDYDEVYDKVAAWVPTLPTAFRRGAEEVMKTGTPEEVAELIKTFKTTTNYQTPSATPGVVTPAAPAAPRTTELSAPAKKAAAALTVVGSKRTTPVAQADAADFDGAWAEAVNQK